MEAECAQRVRTSSQVRPPVFPGLARAIKGCFPSMCFMSECIWQIWPKPPVWRHGCPRHNFRNARPCRAFLTCLRECLWLRCLQHSRAKHTPLLLLGLLAWQTWEQRSVCWRPSDLVSRSETAQALRRFPDKVTPGTRLMFLTG